MFYSVTYIGSRQNRELSLFSGFQLPLSVPAHCSLSTLWNLHSASPFIETLHLAVSKNIGVFVVCEVTLQGRMWILGTINLRQLERAPSLLITNVASEYCKLFQTYFVVHGYCLVHVSYDTLLSFLSVKWLNVWLPWWNKQVRYCQIHYL